MGTTVIESFKPRVELWDSIRVADAATRGWGSRREDYLRKLSRIMSEITRKSYVLPVAHGTDALQLALMSLGIGPGDEVIVPNITWVASASPILHLGATPVLASVDETLCLDPTALESAITDKTAAVVVVDLAGSMPKWDALRRVLRGTNIAVVEDAAEGLGATYKGSPAGFFGDLAAFSFNATKMVTCGQGGAICTDSRDYFERIKTLAHHGIDQQRTGKYYWSTTAGFNYQLSNVQAALAWSQLNSLPKRVAYKQSIYDQYQHRLKGFPLLSLYQYPPHVRSNHWLYPATISPRLNYSKEELILKSTQAKVDIRPFFYQLSDMPPFKQARLVTNPNFEELNRALAHETVCLPYGFNLDKNLVEQVTMRMKAILEEVLESTALQVGHSTLTS